MRTYTRRRPKYQIIEDVNELCRLCLKKAEETVPIYNNDNDNMCTSLALRIMICVGFEVSKEDCLPNNICTDCHTELERYYTFRKKCEVTYLKLKAHVFAFKGQTRNIQKTQSPKDSNPIKCDIDSNDRIKEMNNGASLLLSNNDEKKTESFNPDCNGVIENSAKMINCMEMPETPPTVQSMSPTEKPNMTIFLSTILLELGLLSKSGDKVMLADKNASKIEMETGDSNYMVEFVEEEEDVVAPVYESQVQSNLVKPESTATEDNDVTSNKGAAGVADACGGRGPNTRCGACGKTFATRSALARHRRVHSGERPHACAHCGRRFAQREVMRRHELVHKDRRPYQCKECPKSFTQRGALLAHVRAHVPPHVRPLHLHRCSLCAKVFLHASGLSRHMLSHTGRVFGCAVCARPFRDKSSLQRHIRSAHGPLLAPHGAPHRTTAHTPHGHWQQRPPDAPTDCQNAASDDRLTDVVKTETEVSTSSA